MTIRRICTIHGQAYILVGHCARCGGHMWASADLGPSATAGCTALRCVNAVTTKPPASHTAPVPSVARDRVRSVTARSVTDTGLS
jgi:hypothetical protein